MSFTYLGTETANSTDSPMSKVSSLNEAATPHQAQANDEDNQ